MATVKVTQKRNNSTEINLSGELTIYSAMEIYESHFKELSFKPLVIFKLGKIEEIDTAGMQLLMSLIKTILSQKLEFQIASVSDAIEDFSELFNLQCFLSTEVQNSFGEQ